MWDFFEDIDLTYDSVVVEIDGKKIEGIRCFWATLRKWDNKWEVRLGFIVNSSTLNQEWTEKPVPVYVTMKKDGKEMTISFMGEITVYDYSEYTSRIDYDEIIEINSVGEFVIGIPGEVHFLG